MAVGPSVLYGTVGDADGVKGKKAWSHKQLSAAVVLTCTVTLVGTTAVASFGSQTLVLMKAIVHCEPSSVHVQSVIKSSPKSPTSALALPTKGDPGFAMGVLVPLYSYPTWYDKQKFEWATMVSQANKNQVEVIAIINPANGPGGMHPNAVKNEIEVYRSSHFGFHGVFLDQVPNIWSK